MSQTVGIIGLGRCGMPAAQRFIENGFEVYGRARRAEVIQKFKALGGKPLSNPAEVASRAPVVMIMVLNDDQVIEVLTGSQGILKGAAKGSTVICMSTINRDNLDLDGGRMRGTRGQIHRLSPSPVVPPESRTGP